MSREPLAIAGGRPAVVAAARGLRWPPDSPELGDMLRDYVNAGESLSVSDGGGVVGRLEQRLSDVLGLPPVLTTSSGTAALHLAYLALDLPPGSEVICPALTFHASVTPALHCGLTPVLVDVDLRTGNLSPDAVARAITSRTGAVVVHHNWGHPAPMDQIAALCAARGIRIVEDCSHAYLSRWHDKAVGTFGDIAVFSMQASKALPAGEGGFLATADQGLMDRAILGGHYRGRAHSQISSDYLRRFAESGLGLKYRIHPLAAVVALFNLDRLAARLSVRMKLLGKLSEGIRCLPGIEPPYVAPGAEIGGYFGYRPAFVDDELQWHGHAMTCDEYIGILAAEGVEIHRPSVRPLDELPIFQGPAPAKIGYRWLPRIEEPLAGCAQYFRNRLSLPTFSLPEHEEIVDQYLDAFAKVAKATAARG